jgi:hypothetical protein
VELGEYAPKAGSVLVWYRGLGVADMHTADASALTPPRHPRTGVTLIFKTVTGSWRRGVPAKLWLGVAAGGHGPALLATGVLPVRRPAP